jgi:hypothetical protein
VHFDEKIGMLTVAGKVIRVPGEGLLRVDETSGRIDTQMAGLRDRTVRINDENR